MDDVPLRVETSPDPGDVQALRDRLTEFNAARTPSLSGQTLAIFMRGEDGALQAGLYGWTWSGWLEVVYLWVHDLARGRGIGSRLLRAAEDEALTRGCHTAILDTYSFQAPAFYEQRGYQVYALLEGYPPGHSKLFLRKPLHPHGGA
jgi:GNAT superfamily N-acetyltransferase